MLATYSKLKIAGLVMAAAALSLPLNKADATIVYEDLPTSRVIPPNISWHNANGPILADDFVPITSGKINHVTWWGSEASNLQFEIVLHTNGAGQPALTPAGNNFSGGIKQFVTATSFLYDAAVGIWQFDANVADGWNIVGGQDYWFTTANVNDGWEWAEALSGPTIGSELFNAHRSTGPGCLDGGPHCGPWTDVHTDFAFRINAVPEPATWGMMIFGFAAVGSSLRRRKVRVAFG